MLLELAEHARAQGLPWRIHLACAGPLRAEYETYVRQRRLAEFGHLHGALHAVDEFYRALGLFALTSHSEGHPNALIEAMEAAWLIPDGDVKALSSLIRACQRDERHCAEVAARCHSEGRQRFGIEAMIERYTSLYEGPVSRRRAGTTRNEVA